MTLRFATENSIYLVEEARYMRQPRSEEGRTEEERALQLQSWRLEDGKWHDLREWKVENVYGDGLRLRLWTPDSVHGVTTSLIVEMPEGAVLATADD